MNDRAAMFEPLETRLCLSTVTASSAPAAEVVISQPASAKITPPQVHARSFVIAYQSAAAPDAAAQNVFAHDAVGQYPDAKDSTAPYARMSAQTVQNADLPPAVSFARMNERAEIADRVRLAITERIVHAFVARVQEILSALSISARSGTSQIVEANNAPSSGAAIAAASAQPTVAPAVRAAFNPAPVAEFAQRTIQSTAITILENARPPGADFVATTAPQISSSSAAVSLSHLESAWERIAPPIGMMGGSFHGAFHDFNSRGTDRLHRTANGAGRAAFCAGKRTLAAKHNAHLLTQTAGSIMENAQAIAQTASRVISAPQEVFEFAYLGSPFTLLADSVAGFTDESLAMIGSVPKIAEGASRSSAAWTITAGVIAADLVLLTYINRTRSRRQFPIDLIG